MTGHRRRDRGGHVLYLAALGCLGTVVALAAHLLVHAAAARAAEGRRTSLAAQPAPDPPKRATDTPTRAASAPAAVPITASAPAAATARLTSLTAALPAGSVSVAVVNTVTGASFGYGASAGMTAASVVKLEILETLLLNNHATHTMLSGDEDAEATTMMENSDNDAADAIFDDDGDTAGLVTAEAALGLTGATVPGPDDQWGLTTTSAAEQVALLKNLVDAGSPLDANEKAYALGLMLDVESDQQWGATAVADPGTTPAVKDGWLAVDGDDELWAVNSDAVVTVRGQQVLISVMTQHQQSEQSGIALVQSLAAAAVGAISAEN